MSRLVRFLVLDALVVTLLIAAGGCSFGSVDPVLPPPNITGLSGTVSQDPIADVESRLDAALDAAAPVTVVATVDHRANARTVGQEIRPTRVVFFGNPRLGTPLMQVDPRVGLDLPQNILTYTESTGSLAAYNTPDYLRQRYGLGAVPQLDQIGTALAGLAAAAAGDSEAVYPFASQLATAQGDGLVRVVSTSDAASTISRLREAIEGNDALTLVFELDHQANAASVNLDLGPATVFVFGNPALGSPLIGARQPIGIDLPQKMLVYTDADGETAVLYNDPAYLARRHGIVGAPQIQTIAMALSGLAATAAGR